MAAVQAHGHGEGTNSFTFLRGRLAGPRKCRRAGDFVLARKVLCVAAEHHVVQFSREEFVDARHLVRSVPDRCTPGV